MQEHFLLVKNQGLHPYPCDWQDYMDLKYLLGTLFGLQHHSRLMADNRPYLHYPNLEVLQCSNAITHICTVIRRDPPATELGCYDSLSVEQTYCAVTSIAKGKKKKEIKQ